MSDTPRVPSFLIRGQAYLRCPNCSKIHVHGLAQGTRVAHCDGGGASEYYMEAPKVVPLEQQESIYNERWGAGYWNRNRPKGSHNERV